MVISHVTIITDSALCFNAILGGNFGGNGAIFYVIVRWSTLEINFIFLHIHVLFSTKT